jgi:hypothetical protein
MVRRYGVRRPLLEDGDAEQSRAENEVPSTAATPRTRIGIMMARFDICSMTFLEVDGVLADPELAIAN